MWVYFKIKNKSAELKQFLGLGLVFLVINCRFMECKGDTDWM